MIGVFDSGIGGLTVMREFLRELPDFGYTYLGDTARAPYGAKGPETIQRYARENVEFLLARGAKVIVIACNTASALATETLRVAFPNMPIIEVVTPAVEEAVRATRSGRIGVIGTRATIASGVYEREIVYVGKKIFAPSRWEGERERVGSLAVHGQACPLLVPLVEEGWRDHSVTHAIVREYLAPLRLANIDTLILGCTHYPLLGSVIAREMGESVTIVNPARAIATVVRDRLQSDPTLGSACRGTSRAFHFTDTTPHTARIASEWLGVAVTLEHTELPGVLPASNRSVVHS